MVERVEFRNSDVGAAASDDGDNLRRVPPAKTEALNEQPITSNDRFGLAGVGMNGRNSAPLLGFVVDVVVNKRGGVNQLKSEGEGHDVLLICSACNSVGKEKEDGAKPLSTGV